MHKPGLSTEVKGTSATTGGGLAAGGNLLLGIDLVSHGGVRHVDLQYLQRFSCLFVCLFVC